MAKPGLPLVHVGTCRPLTVVLCPTNILGVVGHLGVSGPVTRGGGSRAGAWGIIPYAGMQVQPDLFPARATLELAEGPFLDFTFAHPQTRLPI